MGAGSINGQMGVGMTKGVPASRGAGQERADGRI